MIDHVDIHQRSSERKKLPAFSLLYTSLIRLVSSLLLPAWPSLQQGPMQAASGVAGNVHRPRAGGKGTMTDKTQQGSLQFTDHP
mmetsp:Transcript_119/g.334  ORF Transcript_119/g.334 Transcript_119/m.334 type:complete len:84 (-) Transcript_119:792-1043(-)